MTQAPMIIDAPDIYDAAFARVKMPFRTDDQIAADCDTLANSPCADHRMVAERIMANMSDDNPLDVFTRNEWVAIAVGWLGAVVLAVWVAG